jgi:hypothetical protein
MDEMKRMLSMLVILMMDFPLLGQNAKIIDLEESFSLGAGTESRSMQGGPNFSDSIYFFSPSFLAVSRYSPRTQFSASYIPEFELFGEHSELNSWNHFARLGATRKISPRFLFDIGESFISTTDPSRQLANSFLLLPRSRYEENAFYASSDYLFTPLTTLSFRYDNTVTRYGLGEEFRKSFLDQMVNAWTASIARRLKEGEKITATYTLLHLTILDSPGQPPEAGSSIPGPTHYFTVGYLNSVSPNLTFGATAGLIHASTFSYALSGQIRKRIGPIWLDTGYSRTLSYFSGQAFSGPGASPVAGGVLANNLYELVTLGANGNLGSRSSLNLRVTGSRTGSGPVGLAGESLIGTLRFDYRITGHMTLYSAAEVYSQNLNRFPGAPTSRHRFYGGIQWSFQKRRPALGDGSRALGAPVAAQTSDIKEE